MMANGPARRTGLLIVLGVLVVSLISFAAACRAGGDRATTPPAPPVDRPQVFELPTSVPATATSPAAETVEPTPAATPEPRFPVPPEGAQLARLLIPAAKVDAPLQIKGVNARREMENPDGKDPVAWYTFSKFPGYGGNAVFSGHVDWYTGERGVFWYLRDAKEGDEITLRLANGMELRYRVTTTAVYKSETAPVAEIVGPLDTDTLTLITCEGVFNRRSQDYSDRRVVRAERVG